MKAYDQWFQLFDLYNSIVPGMFPEYKAIGFKPSARIAQDGRAIVEKLEQDLEARINTSGYADLNSFKRALKKIPNGELALNLFSEGNLLLTIRRPEGARFWIEKTGFQNQRITGSSRGSFDPKYRDNVESLLSHTPPDQFAKLHIETKPKYGLLMSKDLSHFNASSSDQVGSGYGSDLWILKKQITPFVTLTPQRFIWTTHACRGDTVEKIGTSSLFPGNTVNLSLRT